jgi:hypothetical protein
MQSLWSAPAHPSFKICLYAYKVNYVKSVCKDTVFMLRPYNNQKTAISRPLPPNITLQKILCSGPSPYVTFISL